MVIKLPKIDNNLQYLWKLYLQNTNCYVILHSITKLNTWNSHIMEWNKIQVAYSFLSIPTNILLIIEI